MLRTRTIGTALLLTLGLVAAPAMAATAKAGAPCTKKGATATQAGKRLTCVVSGKRLVWRVATSPKPAATPKPLAPGDFTIVAAAKRTPFPKWDGKDFADKAWSTASLTGRVTLVNVWASWCGPCRQEWGDLQAAAAAHKDVTFIGLNSQDRLDDARAFLVTNPSEYLQVFDGNGVVKASLTTVPNRILPLTMIVDAKGRIAAWVPGPTTKAQISAALAGI